MSRKSPVVIPAESPRLVGMVDRAIQDRTRRVVISYSARHPRYGKYVRRRTILHVHDETNDSHKGDRVEIAECRPVSRLKRWALVRIVERAPLQTEMVYGEAVKEKADKAAAAVTGKGSGKSAGKSAAKSAGKTKSKK